jgi:ribosomal protein S18 acetylase RimI-like enzyme
MQFGIRPFHLSDLSLLYRICLQTADSGKDATLIFTDPDLPGHFSVAPYALFEPGLCFVLTNNSKPCGYILGAKDSLKFYERCEKDWFPKLRERYPMPEPDDTTRDAAIIRRIHTGHVVKDELLAYPAHLHVDLLPEAQGHGFGRKLMDTFINKLRELKVPALHLEVGKRNPGAIKFYEKMDFKIIAEYEFSISFGKLISY